MTEDKININGIDYVKASLIEQKKEEDRQKEIEQYSKDPANVMLIGKIQNYEDDDRSKPLHLMFDFERDNKNLKLMVNLKRKDRIEFFKDKEFWVAISKEYYDRANKMIKSWKGETEVYVQKDKNLPILIAGEDLGFVLAPRIAEDGE